MARWQEARPRIFTKRLRPKYGWYLLCWVGLWVLLTVTTQLPECYQRSMSFDAGTPAAIDRDLAEFAATRAFYEVLFGLFWGSVSWALQSYGLYLFDNTPLLKWLRRRWVFPSPLVRPVLAATLLAAFIEGFGFGLPLAGFYVSAANFSLGIGNDAVPPVTINDQSITVQAVGIMLAFILPTLAAGYLTRSAAKPVKLLARQTRP